MKRLLVAARSKPEAWAELFKAELPDHDILLSPPPSSEPVAYVVVGKPEPGLLAGLAGLEVVLSLNAGVEHLLASGEVPVGVPIVRMVDDGLVLGMVDWVTAQVLAWHRNLFVYRGSQEERRWAPRPEKMARERSVTVLGAGALGGAVAARLAVIGFETRVWSRSPREIAGVTSFAGPNALDAAVGGAQILVNLLPLTHQTRDLLGAAVFERLANGSFLINAGRGAHVVDDELIAALDSGRLGGAALDVFREEPLPADHPFWSHPNILVSPHVAAPTHARTAVAAMAQSVRRHERGEPLLHVVDLDRGY
jgi:glyoxylate/hydroxypyruvate reductase A